VLQCIRQSQANASAADGVLLEHCADSSRQFMATNASANTCMHNTKLSMSWDPSAEDDAVCGFQNASRSHAVDKVIDHEQRECAAMNFSCCVHENRTTKISHPKAHPNLARHPPRKMGPPTRLVIGLSFMVLNECSPFNSRFFLNLLFVPSLLKSPQMGSPTHSTGKSNDWITPTLAFLVAFSRVLKGVPAGCEIILFSCFSAESLMSLV